MHKIALLAILIMVAACAAPEVQQTPEKTLVEDVVEEVPDFRCPDGTFVKSARECPVEEEPEPELEMSDELEALQEKAQKVSNYQFTYAELPENKATRKYFVRSDVVRVELYQSMTRPEGSFDTVYLDLKEEKAVAYCQVGSASVCPDKSAIMERPDYEEYAFELPRELMLNLDNGEIAGTITYDSHASDIVIAEHNDEYLRLIVNRFYGIPMKIEFFADASRTGEATGLQLRDFAFNSVTEEQVTPPSGW